MDDAVVSYLKENWLLQRYSTDELTKLGLNSRVLSSLKQDPLQLDPNGFTGAMVLNFLIREYDLPEETIGEAYVPAFSFAQLTDIGLTNLLHAKDGKRPLVVERGKGEERDLYIAVSDLHLAILYRPRKEKKTEPEESSHESVEASLGEMGPLGIYFREVSKHPLLSPEEESDFAEEYQKTGSEEAYTKLVVSNLRYVISIAKGYRGRGLTFEDLICEGNKGLMEAAKKFKPEKGRFTTYSVWWIRQKIRSALAEQGKSTRIPAYVYGDYIRVENTRSLLYNTERYSSYNETLEDALEIERVDEEDFHLARNVMEGVSLDKPLNPYDDSSEQVTRGDRLIADEEQQLTQSQEETIEQIVLERKIEERLAGMNEREAKILRLYFGLGGLDKGYTLQEIGDMMEVTRERIRQIKDRTLENMSKDTQWKELE